MEPGSPPRSISCGRASLAALACATVLVAGCPETTPQRNPPSSEQACIADSIGPLHLVPTISSCRGKELQCRAECLDGKAASCLALGYAADQSSTKEGDAFPLYQRGCLLGAANACTNYAASIWAGSPSDDQLACARRTFEKACTAKEPFACGMAGRLMLESTTPPQLAEGRKYLEAACDEAGGFPCRVLAKHLESRQLGKYPPERIPSLLARACDGGDPDGCGTPPTAEGTFH